MTGARLAVTALLWDLEITTGLVVAAPRSSLWAWRLDLCGEAQLVSSRRYQRRRESISNLARAREALGSAMFIEQELVLPAARSEPPSPVASEVTTAAPDVA